GTSELALDESRAGGVRLRSINDKQSGRSDDATNDYDRHPRLRGMVGMMSAAPAQTALKVIVFPGLSNFSIYAAQHKNLFAKHHLAIELIYTPNSTVLREGLAKGDYQIAHAGVDNSVAMVELAKADAIIVAGGDNGFNHIFVQPEINAYTDLRGKTV